MKVDALIAGFVFSALAALLVRAAFSQPRPGAHRARATTMRPVTAGGGPGAPVQHEGATEGYGRMLHRLRDADIAPELIRPAEQMVADHRALAGPITQAIDLFEMRVGAALAAFTAPLDAATRMRLASAAEETGPLPMAEVRALLAAEDEAGVPA
jgi:hypothetical protein